MKIKNSSQGFTLLELLVVVLIIGILAGIALPKYYRSKEKAEATTLMLNAKALHEAQQRFYLVHNKFATKFDDLDVEFSGYQKGGCESFPQFPKFDCISNSKNVLFISSVRVGTGYSLRKTGKYKYGGFTYIESLVSNFPDNKLLCYEYSKSGFCSDLLKCNLFEGNYTNSFYFCKF